MGSCLRPTSPQLPLYGQRRQTGVLSQIESRRPEGPGVGRRFVRTAHVDGIHSAQLRLGLVWLRTNPIDMRSEEHTSELQSRGHLVCRLLLEKKKNNKKT